MTDSPTVETAPFTVFADLDPFTGIPSRFAAPNPAAAAQITDQLLTRQPLCRARWGPTTHADEHPWPVPVFLRHQATSDIPAGAVHVSLLSAGDTVGHSLSTCCDSNIPYPVAEFTQHGTPCPTCLHYWRHAHDTAEPDASEAASGQWAPVDEELLSRLLTALRALPTDQDAHTNTFPGADHV